MNERVLRRSATYCTLRVPAPGTLYGKLPVAEKVFVKSQEENNPVGAGTALGNATFTI